MFDIPGYNTLDVTLHIKIIKALQKQNIPRSLSVLLLVYEHNKKLKLRWKSV